MTGVQTCALPICYNPVFDHNGQISADNVDSRGLFSNIRSHVRDINPSSFSENLNIRDAEWMKKAIAKFMSTTGNVADKYSRSGNYEWAARAENELKALDILCNCKNKKLAKKAEKELAKRVQWTVDSDEDCDIESE